MQHGPGVGSSVYLYYYFTNREAPIQIAVSGIGTNNRLNSLLVLVKYICQSNSTTNSYLFMNYSISVYLFVLH